MLGGFKAAEKKVIDDFYEEERRKNQDDDDEAAFPVKTSSMAFALTSIYVFKTFSHFLMGKFWVAYDAIFVYQIMFK